ncbi:unnamed protein product [Agarophyton chilense]
MQVVYGVPSANIPPPSDLPVQTPWHFSKTPPFCSKLLKEPRPLPDVCKMDPVSKLCADGKPTFFSHLEQDYYLYVNHFSRLTRRGIYLDIAADEPVSMSNTYFFDACLGWSGLCVEANPTFLSGLYKYRTCAILPTCLSGVGGKSVSFAMPLSVPGGWKTKKNHESWARSDTHTPLVRQVCTTLTEAAKKHKLKLIDYMSLDVQGHELNVLKGIDWEHLIINVMTVEITSESIEAIQTFMVSKEYKRHYPDSEPNGMQSEYVIFLHKKVEWGRPR